MRVFEYPNGYAGNSHRHREAQLVYPLRGVVAVRTAMGEWVAGPRRGVAIPAWTTHCVSAAGNALLHSLFVNPAAHPRALPALTMIDVTPLLHELMREAGRFYVDYAPGSLEERMLGLIIDLVGARPRVHAHWLPRIGNARIRLAIESTPLAELRSAEVAARSMYSQRQFSRIFRAETGMAFKDWRALNRVHAGMKLLARGYSVTETATDLGFASASAFITVFRRHMGVTPAMLKAD